MRTTFVIGIVVLMVGLALSIYEPHAAWAALSAIGGSLSTVGFLGVFRREFFEI